MLRGRSSRPLAFPVRHPKHNSCRRWTGPSSTTTRADKALEAYAHFWCVTKCHCGGCHACIIRFCGTKHLLLVRGRLTVVGRANASTWFRCDMSVQIERGCGAKKRAQTRVVDYNKERWDAKGGCELNPTGKRDEGTRRGKTRAHAVANEKVLLCLFRGAALLPHLLGQKGATAVVGD